MKTKKGLFIMILLGLFSFVGFSQEYEKDVIPASTGDIEITFIKHGTLMLQYGNLTIHVDPVSMFGTDYSKMPKADLILLTHEHGDHLDAKTIKQISTDKTIVIQNAGCYKTLGYGEVMANGASKTFSGVKIDAVPAYNLTKQNHPKGGGNGYVVYLGNTTIYIAGDTDDIPEMNNLKNIDIAFLPMDGNYSMIPAQVANAARIIKPKILYPYHYLKTDPNELVKLLQNEKDIEVRVRQMQ